MVIACTINVARVNHVSEGTHMERSLNGATILIVDDHPAMRMIFRTQLANRMGIGDVLEADNGRSAVEITRKEQPDIVILDLDLPRMGGLEVIPRLRAEHPGVRILVVSGQDAHTYGYRTMDLGADGFVSKTENINAIIRGVEMVMAGYRVFPTDPDGPGSAPPSRDALDDEQRLKQLSNRELLVMRMLVKGQSNQAIAAALHLSPKTISTHKVNLMRKLGASSMIELADFARRVNLSM